MIMFWGFRWKEIHSILFNIINRPLHPVIYTSRCTSQTGPEVVLEIQPIVWSILTCEHMAPSGHNILTFPFKINLVLGMFAVLKVPEALYFIVPSLVCFLILDFLVKTFIPVPKALYGCGRRRWIYHNTVVSLVHSCISSVLAVYW